RQTRGENLERQSTCVGRKAPSAVAAPIATRAGFLAGAVEAELRELHTRAADGEVRRFGQLERRLADAEIQRIDHSLQRALDVRGLRPHREARLRGIRLDADLVGARAPVDGDVRGMQFVRAPLEVAGTRLQLRGDAVGKIDLAFRLQPCHAVVAVAEVLRAHRAADARLGAGAAQRTLRDERTMRIGVQLREIGNIQVPGQGRLRAIVTTGLESSVAEPQIILIDLDGLVAVAQVRVAADWLVAQPPAQVVHAQLERGLAIESAAAGVELKADSPGEVRVD